jgi:hypothetical protein
MVVIHDDNFHLKYDNEMKTYSGERTKNDDETDAIDK